MSYSQMSKGIKFFDIHGHINFPEFDADRNEVIGRTKEAGVGMITVGVDYESSKKAIELAEVHEGIWATAGIHPIDDAGHQNTKVESLKELAKHNKVVAIGECGLDYFHSKPDGFDVQRKIFEDHIALANELNKPLMLHIRNGKTKNDIGGKADNDAGNQINAYHDAVAMLKKSAKVRANFHFFAGTIKDLKEILEIGGTVSFTGVVTFTRDYDELVKYAPIDRLMSETDCPFVAPVPFRGKRNEPAFVVETVKAIAEIRGQKFGEVSEQLVANSVDFFGVAIPTSAVFCQYL